MNRRQFLSTLSTGALASLCPAAFATSASTQPRRPNIILILLDDLGYADLGCNGSRDLKTPHIDRLASAAVRFTDACVCSPVCSPSRAGLLTGRYPQRFGHEFNPRIKDNRPGTGLPLSETTLAQILREHGYSTGMVGKWHLGLAHHFHPLWRGFDEFFGFLNSSHSYTDLRPSGDDPICRNYLAIHETEYLTDAFTREAVSFITRHQHHPFFLYLPYSALHVPMETPPSKYMDRFASIRSMRRRTYAAMLAAVDDGIGRILDTLASLGLEQDTLIFFLSDNGGPHAGTTANNAPFTGGKGGLREGGIRTPFFLQWKGHLRPGTYPHPVSSLDVFPTVLSAAGVTPRPALHLDGIGLLPFLHGPALVPPHEFLFWRYGAEFAIRRGRWKLLRLLDGSLHLYDVGADPGERQDLAGAHPEMLADLKHEWDRWNAQLLPPRWLSAPSISPGGED